MRKLTHSDFEKSIDKNKFKLISKYKTGRIKIKVKCKKCNFVWNVIPKTLRRNGCPECGRKKARETKKWNFTSEDFTERIPDNIKNKIEILGTYTKSIEKIKVKCKQCKRIWDSKPIYLYKNCSCHICARKEKGLKSRISHVAYLNRISDKYDNDIRVIGQYKTGRDRIAVVCNKCGHKWNPVAHGLYSRGCPCCNFSKGEYKISRILQENNVSFQPQYSFKGLKSYLGGHLSFDFVIINNNKILSLVEYDGQQHFEPIKHFGGEKRFEIQKKNDKIKNDFCKDNGYYLNRISYKMFSKINLEMILERNQNEC